MTRTDYVLAVMAAAREELTPVQVQKLFFILDKKAAAQVGGPHFNFQPYNYGPFDAGVYRELDALIEKGLVVMTSTGSSRQYGIAPAGSVFSSPEMKPETRDYVHKLASWIRSLSFGQLVSAVYKEWPDMQANSIFRG